MHTKVNNCQFICISQDDYCRIMQQVTITTSDEKCVQHYTWLTEKGVPAIGVDSGGQPGHAPPIIKMGGGQICSPNNQRRIFYFFIFVKKT